MKKQLERLMFIGIGGLIAIISFSIGNTEKNTAKAQDEAPIVDIIRCRELQVLDKKGNKRISLSLDGDGDTAYVILREKDESINGMFYASEHGSDLVLDPGDSHKIHLATDKVSSGISLGNGANSIRLSTFDGLGSFVWVHAKSTIPGVFQSGMELHAHSNGAHVDVEERVRLESKNNVAQVAIFNKASKKVGAFAVIDDGSGILVTGDKQGKSTGTVP